MTSIGWTWEPENASGRIPFAFDFEITGNCWRGEPMVRYYPDGSGYPGSPPVAEIVDISLEVIHGMHRHAVTLQPRRARIERVFRSEIDRSKSLLREIEDALLEAAEEIASRR